MDTSLDSYAITHIRRQRELALRSTLLLLFIADLILIALACIIGFYIRFTLLPETGIPPKGIDSLDAYKVHIVSAIISMGALLYFNGCYRIDLISRSRYSSLRMLGCSFYWASCYIFISLFFKIEPEISRLWVAYSASLMALILFFWRHIFSRYLLNSHIISVLRRDTIIVGWNDQTNELYKRSQRCIGGESFFQFNVKSAILLEETRLNECIPEALYAGKGVQQFKALLASGNYDTVMLANSNLSLKEISNIQEICGLEMVDFMMVPDFFQTLTSCLHVESFGGIPLLTQTKRALDRTSSAVIKRCFDLIGALVGLSLSAPIVIYFTVKVYLESKGPVFYYQTRLGKNGKPFRIIKIRSMRLDAEKNKGAQWCSEEDPRRLKVGEVMRKYNIDELPQFWNVLCGEMSLVGPRPERPELIKNFKHQVGFYNLRHTVKPGMTGWAQVNGWRGDTSLDSRVAFDIEYIERWSPWFDIYICLRTLRATKNAY